MKLVIAIIVSLLAFYFIILHGAPAQRNLIGAAIFSVDSLSCLSAGNYWCSSSTEDGYCSEMGNCRDGYSYEPKLVALPDLQNSKIDRKVNTLSLKVQLESTHPIERVVMQLDNEEVQGSCEKYGASAICAFEKSLFGMPDEIQPVFIADVDDYDTGYCEL